MSKNPWSRHAPPGMQVTQGRIYEDKPGVIVPMTPGHDESKHAGPDGEPPRYEQRTLTAHEVIALGKESRRAQKPSPVREELLRRARIL